MICLGARLTTAEIWLLVFSGVVAVSTFVYAILTWRLVGETRRMRLAQTEPMISVTYQVHQHGINYVDFCVRNVGAGPAFGIRLEVEPNTQIFDKKIAELNIIKNGIKYLGPGDERRFFLTFMDPDKDDDAGEPFEVMATYRGAIGKEKTERFVIDLSEMVGLYQHGNSPAKEVSSELKKLNREFSDFRKDFKSRG